MASSIGVRIYTINLHKRSDSSLLSLDSKLAKEPPAQFIFNFIKGHATPTRNDTAERSWYFESKEANEFDNKGYLHYGTFGFESNFVDTKTKTHNYRRKVTDVEEIPLFYEFWFPENSNTAFVAFQSFQGRSCVGLVLSAIKELFEENNGSIKLIFTKLMPSSIRGGMYRDAEIKRLRLVKKNYNSDIASRQLGGDIPETIDYEVTFTARKKSYLGRLGSLADSMKKNGPGLMMHEGINFDEAVAEVKVGNKLRRVGVFGRNTDAGVIDLSADIKKGLDGHPTFDSLSGEVDALLQDFYITLGDIKR
ncbi:hypothetical protein [Methylobacterium sp. Leaf89]|uniref:hypothetical protein n=1 Tax=Methylobacterium sp. Leaf89 TaxID=1736245 RepID=UPI000AE69BCB|nr:hypothetical protein [Methylobacterium sp. Leaf89]